MTWGDEWYRTRWGPSGFDRRSLSIKCAWRHTCVRSQDRSNLDNVLLWSFITRFVRRLPLRRSVAYGPFRLSLRRRRRSVLRPVGDLVYLRSYYDVVDALNILSYLRARCDIAVTCSRRFSKTINCRDNKPPQSASTMILISPSRFAVISTCRVAPLVEGHLFLGR